MLKDVEMQTFLATEVRWKLAEREEKAVHVQPSYIRAHTHMHCSAVIPFNSYHAYFSVIGFLVSLVKAISTLIQLQMSSVEKQSSWGMLLCRFTKPGPGHC